MSITYTSYLKINELLKLQQLQSDPPEHDETLFIIIHQTYELWFKQIIHEFGKLNKELQSGHTWTSIKTMRRILTIMKTLVAQVDILETMTPLEFNSFRKFLGQSSGFQSLQFREVEILCGMRFPLMKEAHKDIPKHIQILEQRMEEPTIWESFCSYLTKKGYAVSAERKNEQGLLFNTSEQNQQELIRMMKEDPETALVAELLVDFDEGLQEWRYRHVKMVQRTIGAKTGTGGSEGVAYLQLTLHKSIFPDLWEIRSSF